jgi:hypothetical protein
VNGLPGMLVYPAVMCACMCGCVHVCVCVHLCVFTCVYIYVCTCVYVYLRLCVCVRAYVLVHVLVCVCVHACMRVPLMPGVTQKVPLLTRHATTHQHMGNMTVIIVLDKQMGKWLPFKVCM